MGIFVEIQRFFREIVAAHTGRTHIRNRIVFNSTSLDCTRNFQELVGLLEQAGYACQEVMRPAIQRKNQKKFVRFKSLGDGYTPEDLDRVFCDRNLLRASLNVFSEDFYLRQGREGGRIIGFDQLTKGQTVNDRTTQVKGLSFCGLL